MGEEKGISLAIAAAIVSGFSIFINKFAVAESNPFVFTTTKNALVAVFLISAIILLNEFKNLKSLSKKHWAQLAIIGLVGGSIPFLIYFYSLKLTTAVNAGLIHKTLFVWAFVFAAVFLKERVSMKFLIGGLLLLAGNFFLFSNFSEFIFADALIFVATIFWAAENVISKHALKELHGRIVAFGRMLFGSLFMLVFLGATGQIGEIFVISYEQFAWTLITSMFLFLYVFFYYTGLKYVRVSVATALLLLAQPITFALSMVFLDSKLSQSQALGFLLILIGATVIVGTGYFATIGRKAKAIALKIA